MKKVILTILAMTSITALTWYVLAKDEVNEVMVETSEDKVVTEASTTFAWRFSPAETNNLDGQPKTNVFLISTRKDKKIERLVDTVDGSCSESLGEKHEGDVSGTGRVQCYAAGFGQKYRITGGGQIYLIERMYFEEALPDIVPLRYEWEVIGDFSFKQI